MNRSGGFFSVLSDRKVHKKKIFFFDKHFNKNGQMEVVGLVVVVILITLAMLFLVSFGIKGEESEKIFTRKQLASSSMGAIMKATVDPSSSTCVNYGFEKDLLDDCASNHITGIFKTNCEADGEILNSCHFLQKRITEILTNTLGVWKKSWDFKATLMAQEPQVILFFKNEEGNAGGCPKMRGDRDEVDYLLNTEGGNVRITLRICQ